MTNLTMSDISFAHPSTSRSSSYGSSEGSSYSTSRTPGLQDEFAPELRVSDVDLADVEGIVYALAVSPDSPVGPELLPKTPYPGIYTQPTRRHRYRARSRGRQPYPQRSSPDRLSRRGRFRRNKPDLKLNVELPSFLPMHVHSNGSTTVGTHPQSRSRFPDCSIRTFADVREKSHSQAVLLRTAYRASTRPAQPYLAITTDKDPTSSLAGWKAEAARQATGLERAAVRVQR